MELADLATKLGRVTSLAGGVRSALRILLIGNVGAAVALVLGLVLLGMTGSWFWFALSLGLVALVPAPFLWRGMGMFSQIEDLPTTLTDLGHLPERAADEVRSVISTAVSPAGARSAIWESRALLKELMNVLPIVDFVKSFNVLSLTVTAAAAVAVPVVALIALLVLLLGVLT